MSASGHGSSETQKYGSDTCHAYVDGVSTSYGYVPSLAAASTFVALFGASMLGHAIQMVWFRTWWCSVFSLGCLGLWTITKPVLFMLTETQSKFSDGQPEFGLLNVPMLRHHISCKLPPLS